MSDINEPQAELSKLEIWGGVECTVNRVKDCYSDQCALNGHENRIDDLERFAQLGFKKLRYPLLWEKASPESLDEFDWSWGDERLNEIKRLGMDPIVTLLHHGSGPRYTSLIDPEFPEKFAKYAGAAAARFPWLTYYTPVNEPLTTARFSGLYGVWYPHGRDDKTFVRALYNEIKGTVLAMRAIREVNPKAMLVQTDDMGRAQGRPALQPQVEFENHRRWLGYDMLAGWVDRQHIMRDYLITRGGLTHEELDWLVENPCPPDIIGINHYPLSNRFMDERRELYPEFHYADNGWAKYVDVGAVDTGQAEPIYPKEILKEVWDRYHIPVAVTECHIAGGRESQMRWLKEVWDSAQELRNEGVDLKAVTVWSLLGAYDWNSLCTTAAQFYESGVFDVRTNPPRPTEIATMIRQFADGQEPDHPVLARVGYWREPIRMRFAPSERFAQRPAPLKTPRPILITGARGTLGRAFARICDVRGLDYRLLSRQEMDIASPDSVQQAIKAYNPWAVINAAGYVRVDDAESDQERCLRENAHGPRTLASVCADNNVQLVTFSSDMVFDGTYQRPYRESDPVAPLNIYGQSKAQAERWVLESHPNSLVVRTSAFFGPWDEYNFVHTTALQLKRGEVVRAVEDMIVSPTYVPDLVWTVLDLLVDREHGLVHLANCGSLSWAEWARWTAKLIGADPNLVIGVRTDEFGYPAQRPRYSVLESERGRLMPSLEKAFEIYVHELDVNRKFSSASIS